MTPLRLGTLVKSCRYRPAGAEGGAFRRGPFAARVRSRRPGAVAGSVLPTCCHAASLAFLSSGHALAQSAAIKAPKPKQVISQLTQASSRALGLSGPQRMLFGLSVVFALLLAVYLWKRLRRGKGPAESAKALATPQLAEQQPSIAVGELLNVWRRFLRRLPRMFRRSIDNFQPLLVLGPAAAGKTSLLSRYTDWQRQARQALQSDTKSPHLQIYVSSRAVALELGAGLLWDASVKARRALSKLFARLGRSYLPVVVVVLDLSALNRMSPDTVRALADAIRAKINLLADARHLRREAQALEVRLALTHLDSLVGYEVFAQFAQEHDIPLSFSLKLGQEQPSVAEQVAVGMARFGSYLSLALTRLSAERYKAVVTFLREAPAAFSANLPAILSGVFADDPLSRRPRCGPIFLTCEAPLHPGGNPFYVAGTEERVPKFWGLHPRWLAAYGAALAACGWLTWGFFAERSLFEEVVDGVSGQSVEANLAPESPVRRFLRRRQGGAQLLPSFYGAADQPVGAWFSRHVRERRLLPRYERAVLRAEWPVHEALCHLAVIHAGQQPALGALARDLIQSGRDRWPDKALMEDYLAVAAREPARLMPLDQLGGDRPPETSEWVDFGERLRAALDHGSISEVKLVDLQENARSVQRRLGRVQLCGQRELSAMGPGLRKVYGHALSPVEAHLAQHDALLTPLRGELGAVLSTEPPPPRPRSLPELAAALRSLLTTDGRGASRASAGQVTVGPEAAAPESVGAEPTDPAPHGIGEGSDGMASATIESRWRDLVLRSRIGELLKTCEELLHASDSTLFSADGARAAGAGTRRSSAVQERGLFVLPVELDPLYTRAAFDTEVKPALAATAAALREVGVRELSSPIQLQSCREGLRHRVGEYADAYGNALQSYYQGFRLHASSDDDVDVVFRYLSAPVSPLTAFLDTVHANSQLDLTGEDELLLSLLEPLRSALQPFSALNQVMTAGQGTPRKLDEYLLRMDQIRTRLIQRGEAVADAAAAQSLHDRLGGPGQIALEALTAPEDSVGRWLEGWLEQAGLWGAQARPFGQPIEVLLSAGNAQVEHELAEVWHHDVLPQLTPLMRKFPFTPKAEAEVTAAELEQAFHPVEGMMMDRYHRFFEPVTHFAGSYKAHRDGPRLPGNMLTILNRVAALTHALWDEKGAPRELAIVVRPIPFGPTRDMQSVLTLAYVRFGDTALFNFNQRPTSKELSVAWTSPQMSQIGVQLTDARSGQQRYPRSLGTAASYFSPLRLIEEGVRPASALISREPGGLVLTERQWRIPYGDGESRGEAAPDGLLSGSDMAQTQVMARFLVDDALLGLFNFGELTREDEVRFAAANPGGTP